MEVELEGGGRRAVQTVKISGWDREKGKGGFWEKQQWEMRKGW
jgi:hypothetical protein